MFQEASFDGEAFGGGVDRIVRRWTEDGYIEVSEVRELRAKALFVRSEVSSYYDRKHDKSKPED